MGSLDTDLLIAGGGLAGSLLALALAECRPEVRVTIVEPSDALGGNHVWSFFDHDVTEAGRALLAPLVVRRWPEHEVRFPGQTRRLPFGYNSITSEQLDRAVRARLRSGTVHRGRIAVLDAAGATLEDGTRIVAAGVVDARGAGDAIEILDLGWQKFLGQMLRLEQPHGLTRPTIMDATVSQEEGYRFMYLLPFGPDRLFVEDTYYQEEPSLHLPTLRARIDAYVQARGWRIAAVEREEAAALPIAMAGDFRRLWPGGEGVARVGMAAGLFQPMTGYSLPDAVRAALLVAALPDLSSAALAATLRAHAASRWEAGGFYRLLARMLFRAAEPEARWRVLARFYRLDAGIITRFYAGASTWRDKLRILAGRPPVPVGRALGQLRERAA